MQAANARSALGRFDGNAFEYSGIRSTFSKKDTSLSVTTDGPDGTLTEFPVAYAFGIYPLQQYLLPIGRGRLQALSLCWDARPATEGGQRWFHLYPDDHVDHRDPLHWTRPAQNWNHMCAECHSTAVKRGYDAKNDTFETTWSEISVSCESCHGPGSRHVEWAATRGPDPLRGFAAPQRGAGAWAFADAGNVARRTGGNGAAELQMCARCHSRRGQFADAVPGAPLHDSHRLALLDEELYHADGQILDEVYEYGSFLQSRMHAEGVTCSNCHDPHTARLKAQGNALCAQCHNASTYDNAGHYHHSPGSAGSRCVDCHMTERTYMGVDGRRDHSFRVPRPDLTSSLGTPNACNGCHDRKSPEWAAQEVRRWFGETRTRGPRFAEALAAGRAWKPEGGALLRRAVEDPSVPGIARATAVTLLPRYLTPASRLALAGAARDPDPLVRRAVAEVLESLQEDDRVTLGVPLLSDPSPAVRLETAPALAGVSLGGEAARARDAAVAEYRAALAFTADRAESHHNLGALELALGRLTEAEAAFSRALFLDASFVPAAVNLADLRRAQGREAECERVVREALKTSPGAAAARFALGLSLVRQRRHREALPELKSAAEAPGADPRYAWVHAAALEQAEGSASARAALRATYQRYPAYGPALADLSRLAREAKDLQEALSWAKILRDLDPAGEDLVRSIESELRGR